MPVSGFSHLGWDLNWPTRADCKSVGEALHRFDDASERAEMGIKKAVGQSPERIEPILLELTDSTNRIRSPCSLA
ncbi:MAG: hypothetical protein CMI15_12765 [Opitutaceae bacterium]|nr:hypothetical protein [Opitutaceae bacterium]